MVGSSHPSRRGRSIAARAHRVTSPSPRRGAAKEDLAAESPYSDTLFDAVRLNVDQLCDGHADFSHVLGSQVAAFFAKEPTARPTPTSVLATSGHPFRLALKDIEKQGHSPVI